MELARLQAAVGQWSRHNFDDQPSWMPLLGAVEELGELAHAHLKREQKIRGGLDQGNAAQVDAIGDILIYLADYCEREHIDMSHAVSSTWWEVSKRDWKKFPWNGKDK